ncbi:hypothetical protein ACLQ3B_00875 [Micromonospora sp. DT53]|uniref:hypothetical protein n=1 Tax=Micromonospora sp. DT53 TaxID=3393444 RepID=UPI003CF9D7B3
MPIKSAYGLHALLTLAGRPGYDLKRTRDWAALDATHRLLDTMLVPARALS